MAFFVWKTLWVLESAEEQFTLNFLVGHKPGERNGYSRLGGWP